MFLLLLRKNLFFLPSRYSFSSSPSSQLGRLLLTPLSRFQVSEFSSSPPSQSHWNWNCSCNVTVTVWWDVDNCGVPSGVSVLKVAPSIMAAVRANGIKGKINIIAYGDFDPSKVDRDALDLTNVTRVSVHNYFGEKNKAYRALIRDLNSWVSDNPPPAHLFLILGDRDDREFSHILHRLRMNNYNILIASSGRASDTLCSATTIMWQWSSMLKGEDVIGKRFNHPPDAPFNSFYGGFKMPLGNPFSATQEPTSSQNAKIQEPFSNTKLSEVPTTSSQNAKIQEPFSNIKLSEVPKSLYRQVKKISTNWVPSTPSAVMNNQRDSRKEVDEVCHNPSYFSPDNSLVEKKRCGAAETYSKSSTLFSWISSWWTFWKSGAKFGDFTHQDVSHSRKPELFEDSKSSDQTAIHFEEPESLELQQDVSYLGMPEEFSIDCFWEDVEYFVFTPRGSHLLSQSTSREDLAHKLQKHGPRALKRLTKNDILQLVELLIAEKKWLEENPSQEFPFRLN